MKVFLLIKRFFTEKFELNVPALAICFVLSCFIYYVYRAQTLRERAFDVPLEIVADGTVVPSAPHVKSVQVQILGNPDDVAALSERDFRAYLDLNYATQSGRITVPVLLTRSDEAGRIKNLETKCFPGSISLQVEKFASKSVKIEPIFSGAAAEGFKRGDVSVSPSEVLVSGPASRIESLQSIKTQTIDISGSKKDFVADADLKSDDKNLNLSETSVSVSVKILPEGTERNLGMVKVNLSGVPSNLIAVSHTASVPVSIYGSKSEVESYKIPNNLVSADCSSVKESGRFDVPVVYSVPSKFRQTGEIVEYITAEFREKIEEPTAKSESAESGE